MTFFLMLFAAACLPLPAAADVLPTMRPSDSFPSCVEQDPVAGHRFRAGCSETVKRGGRESKMSYNALGLRDKDYPAKPRKGWKRVLLVGATRLAGAGLKENEVPARRLEVFLRQLDPKTEVINAGVEGYGPIQQSAKLREWIRAYSPTHVVVQVELTAALSNELMAGPFVEEAGGALVARPRLLRAFSPVASLLGLRPTDPGQMKEILAWEGGLHRAWRSWSCKLLHRAPRARMGCLFRLTLRAFELMHHEAEAAGAKLAVTFSPGLFRSELLLSPAFDAAVATRLYSFTPDLELNANPLSETIARRGVAVVTGPAMMVPSNLAADPMRPDPDGADSFARGLGIRLAEFLGL